MERVTKGERERVREKENMYNKDLVYICVNTETMGSPFMGTKKILKN